MNRLMLLQLAAVTLASYNSVHIIPGPGPTSRYLIWPAYANYSRAMALCKLWANTHYTGGEARLPPWFNRGARTVLILSL